MFRHMHALAALAGLGLAGYGYERFVKKSTAPAKPPTPSTPGAPIPAPSVSPVGTVMSYVNAGTDLVGLTNSVSDPTTIAVNADPYGDTAAGQG